MDIEIESLRVNGVYELVNRPAGKKVPIHLWAGGGSGTHADRADGGSSTRRDDVTNHMCECGRAMDRRRLKSLGHVYFVSSEFHVIFNKLASCIMCVCVCIL